MSFTVSKMILHNRAPFEHLEIDFKDKSISILSGVNGSGKTTILSHIADAWYEIVRIAFALEFEGKENKFYRVSSSNFSLDRTKASVVYIRFNNNSNLLDYVDVHAPCSDVDYNAIIQLDNKISYNAINESLNLAGNVKHLSEQNGKELEKIFNANVVTYFPSYRHERPGYMNTPFDIKLDYNLATRFSGYLRNPIEVISDLLQLANWLMDIVLDMKMDKDRNIIASPVSILFFNVNSVFTKALSIKSGKNVFLGIGSRNDGVTRIQIGERDGAGNWTKTVYPSIFNMSSGENAMICLFVEILRHFDNIMLNLPIQSAQGVVLIDEIDKHLHIRMQKDVLPKLMQLFPNIQFIVSSHSPFIAMGLDENISTQSRTQIIDLDNNGLLTDLSATRVFTEGYNAMIEKNKQYKELYDTIKAKLSSSKLQIVSEGHNVEHIKRAIELIDSNILNNTEFCFSDKSGYQQLKTAYEAISSSNPQAKYLFVFDFDCENSVNQLVENDNFFRFIFEKNVNNPKVKKGIENLYPMEIFTGNYYRGREEEGNYGEKKTIQDFDKNAFLSAIKKDEDVSHFENFKPLIDRIRNILVLIQEQQEVSEGLGRSQGVISVEQDRVGRD